MPPPPDESGSGSQGTSMTSAVGGDTSPPATLVDYDDQLRTWLAARTWSRPPVTPDSGAAIEALVEHGASVMAELYRQGWNRCGWPEPMGGTGGDARFRAVLYDRLAASQGMLPEHVVALETLGPALVHFAPHLASRWLPRCLAGDEMWCQGFSEPDSGSDLASLRCRAQAVNRGGDEYFVINGHKTWTTLGHLSDRVALLCRTGAADSRHRGLTLFMVDIATPGITVRPIRMANGRNEFSELFLSDVEVPSDRVVGSIDGGWAVAMHILQFERGMYAWQRQAWLHARLGQLVQHLSAHGPISDLAARRIGVARLALHALRVRSGFTVARLAQNSPVGPEASVDKILLAQAEKTLLDTARELAPELFMTRDGMGEAWRANWFYTRAASIYGGSAEIQRGIVADHVLALPREPR